MIKYVLFCVAVPSTLTEMTSTAIGTEASILLW